MPSSQDLQDYGAVYRINPRPRSPQLPVARSIDASRWKHLDYPPMTGLPRQGRPLDFFGGLVRTGLALYQALISINIPEQKANAVIEALESDMHSLMATKADLAALHAELKADLAQLEVKLTIRMGLMLSATAGVMLAALRGSSDEVEYSYIDCNVVGTEAEKLIRCQPALG